MKRRKRQDLIWTKAIDENKHHCSHCSVALSVGSTLLLDLSRNEAVCQPCAERLSLGKDAPFHEAMKICEYGEIQCVTCKNLISGLHTLCRAFPEGEGIPVEIITGKFDHRRAWPDSKEPQDRGVRWEGHDENTPNPFDARVGKGNPL